MEKMHVVINDTLGAYGGGQTLIERMCIWMRDNGHSVSVLCLDDSNSEIVEKLKKIDVSILKSDVWEIKKQSMFIQQLLTTYKKILVINFAWNQYLNMELIKKRHKLMFRNLIYCIHPETFFKGNRIGNDLLKKIVIDLYRKTYKKMCLNQAVVMMDEINNNRTNEYLSVTDVMNNEFIRIPITIKANNNWNDIVKEGYTNNIIFTSCRAEIPFKGYLLGLIKDFSKLKNEFPSIKLVIVSAGNDIDLIRHEIEAVPDNIRKDIFLHGWMEYSHLLKEMETAKIVVGMGTTILDASCTYKPSIPVAMYTTDNKSTGFFFHDYRNLVSEASCKTNAYDYIKQSLKWTEEEYTDNCLKSFEVTNKNYGIDFIMPKLLNIPTKTTACCVSRIDCMIHAIVNQIRKVKYQNYKEFDYSNITKENDK